METFKAKIEIIGINLYVHLPLSVLTKLFKQAQRDKGPIPVRGKIDRYEYIQTVVKYSGAWRLYINTRMLKVSKKKVGDSIVLEIEFDPLERITPIHPKLENALKNNKEAKQVFDNLSPSRQKEIIRYINFLKTEISVDRNVLIAINFLLGKSRFVGRDKP